MSIISEIDDTPSLLEVETCYIKTICNLLKCISFKDTATIYATNKGLKITVENAKAVQVNAFIQSSLFQVYQLERECALCLNLASLIDFLGIYMHSTSPQCMLRMKYDGDGPLSMVMLDDEMLVDCTVETLMVSECLDFNFNSSNVANKIIVQADCLRDVFADMDYTSDVLQIGMFEQEPYFRMTTYGNIGKVDVEIPKTSAFVERFECNKDSLNNYKLQLLKPCVRVLPMATKVSLRLDYRGFLSIQFLIKSEQGEFSFVEFFCVPDEEMED